MSPPSQQIHETAVSLALFERRRQQPRGRSRGGGSSQEAGAEEAAPAKEAGAEEAAAGAVEAAAEEAAGAEEVLVEEALADRQPSN